MSVQSTTTTYSATTTVSPVGASVETATRTKIKVYGVGGAGISIVTPYVKGVEVLPGFSNMDVVLFDTSHSNILPNIPKEKFFFVDGAEDGSGKDKSVNVRAIKTAIPRMLSTEGFEPEQMNVIMGSTSGGKTLPVVN